MSGRNAFEQYVSVLTTEYIENRMSYYSNVRREYYTGRKWWLYAAIMDFNNSSLTLIPSYVDSSYEKIFILVGLNDKLIIEKRNKMR